MRRLRRIAAEAAPAMLAGAFCALAGVLLAGEPAGRPGALLGGALYGLAVVGLLRLFRVAPGAYPAVGLLCGPAPAALLFSEPMTSEEAFGTWVALALFGVLVGVLEWARVRAAIRAARDPA